MATVPTFTPFDPAKEQWSSFMGRFECFLIANDFTQLSPERKLGYFLSCGGPLIFATASSIAAPAAVHEVPWDTLRDRLRDHYAPAPSKLARCFAFRRCVQLPEQSVVEFLQTLRAAAVPCEFPQATLNDRLLEQFVYGVRDARLRRRLMAKAAVTLDQAIEEARAAEISESSSAEFERFPPPQAAQNQACNACDFNDPIDVDEHADSLRSSFRRTAASSASRRPSTPCIGCGGNHRRIDCPFKAAVCRTCGRKGHLALVCRSTLPPVQSQPGSSRMPRRGAPLRRPGRRHQPLPGVFTIGAAAEPESVSSAATGGKRLSATVKIEGVDVTMEIDSGSSRSLISWALLSRVCPSLRVRDLAPSPVVIRDYQGAAIPTLGMHHVRVDYAAFHGILPLIVVKNSLSALLGLDWFSPLGLSIQGIFSTSQDSSIEGVLAEFKDLFDGTLGSYKGTPVSLNLDPQVAPIRLKARRLPFALKPKVEAELDRLVAQGVLEPVDQAKWETPIVVPIKPDGSIRICADYKSTINRGLQANPYPVPVVQHLLHSLGRGKVFAKLDMAQAYQQLPVDDEAAEAQTIVTHRGAFRCRRLQFGVAVAPGIFQSLMERLLHGLPGVVPYFDDVLIAASSVSGLAVILRKVLARLRGAGLKLKRGKCQFAVPRVEFLGFLIDAQGIHPTPAKVKAIREAPTPASKTELQAFLGLLNFYAPFLPHKASVAEPLHRLLDRSAAWHWGSREARAFAAVKELLSSGAVLVQYSDKLPLTLACDASPFGVGAVLSHVLTDGSEAPIAFFSRTMSSTERNYSQIDKEALAMVSGIKKFHNYLYGRSFSVFTDHKPLLGILAGDRPTPQILSPRMTRWTEFLTAYDYTLFYRPGKQLGHADALSRCPLPDTDPAPVPARSVLSVAESGLPLSSSDVAALSRADPVLSRVMAWILRGWPSGTLGEEFRPYKSRQMELSLHSGCICWGDRVVIPPPLRRQVLDSLHANHPGIVRMKALGRSYVWWPRLDADIAAWVGACSICQESRPAPPVATPRDWEVPRSPWARVHIDFAGPFHGQTFLVVVDAYSRWVEIALMTSTTAESTVRVLRRLFATHGLPDTLVSDNGPQFHSSVFQEFLASMGIRHAPTAPWHPASNGRAERAVRAAKEALSRLGTSDWQARVDAYLMGQHSTPCPTTGKSPAELLMGRRLRTTLDRLHPHYNDLQPCNLGTPSPRLFSVGEPVFARNFSGDPKWVPATISALSGPCSFRVRLPNGSEWRRHLDQLRRRSPSLPDSSQASPSPTPASRASADFGRLFSPACVPVPSASSEFIPPWTQSLPLCPEDCGVGRKAPIALNGTSPPSQTVSPLPARATPHAAPPIEVAVQPKRLLNNAAPQAAKGQLPNSNTADCKSPPLPRRSERTRRRPTYLKDYHCASSGTR